MVHLTVQQPRPAEELTPGLPLRVTGTATGTGGLEPAGVDTVRVTLDGGASVDASLTFVPHQPAPTVVFDVTLPGPTAPGDHSVSVTGVDDVARTATVVVLVHVPPQGGTKAKTPEWALRVDVVNPPPPDGDDWAADLVQANRSLSPLVPSLLDLAVWHEVGDAFMICAREWLQIAAPEEDEDLDPVGLSGWLLQPELSQRDVPFTHPFGLDWECMVALDPPYAGLLAPGNHTADGADGQQALADAQELDIDVPPGGLLAIETDGNNVPSALKDFPGQVRVGDRIAVFGRWIVDSAHTAAAPDGHASYRSEVHPPLLMATAGTRPDGAQTVLTRLLLTSRPYLARQVFTTDVGKINDDEAPDDGTLLVHLNRELDKLHGVIPDSVTIEAHPKIAAKPFVGTHLFRLSVGPPDAGPEYGEVQVSFQLTHRPGVGVQVIGMDDHVDVLVALNSVGYDAPALPARQEESWDKERLENLDPDAANLVTFEQLVGLVQLSLNTEQALFRGVVSEHYDTPDVDLLERSHLLPFVRVDQIPAGLGIVEDATQPYPVVGFVEVRRHVPDVVLGTDAASRHPAAVPHPTSQGAPS